MIPRVLITNTTWWPCASRLATALLRSGCEVGVVYPRRGHPLDKTAGLQHRFPYDTARPLSSLADAIKKFEPDLLVPGDDRAVQHLHELYAATAGLRPLIERSLGPAASYEISSSRESFLRIAREQGLIVPEFAPLDSEQALDQWCAGHPAPWVLKADGSWGGHGVSILNDALEARHFLHRMARPVSSPRMLKRVLVERDAFWLRDWWKRRRSCVIAQEHIPGHPANCAAFAWKGELAGLICLEVLQSNGAKGAATVVRVIESPEMRVAAERIARRLELSGFFGLDFMLDRETGIPYLIELNPRCTPPCHLALGGERDLVEGLRSRLSGEPRRHSEPATSKDCIAYFPQAWHWNRNSPALQASFHDVPWEDPELIRELLKIAWPDRSMPARIWNRLRGTTIEQRARASEPGESLDTGSPLLHAAQPSSDPRRPASLVLLQRGDGRDPLFLVHGVEGHLGHVQKLVRYLDPNQTVYGVISQALLRDGNALTRVEDMAAFYVRQLRSVCPSGPYNLLGFSFGAFVCFEMARQLLEQGQVVGLVGMIDSRAMGAAAAPARSDPAPTPLHPASHRSAAARHLAQLLTANGLRYARDKVSARGFRTAYTFLDRMRLPIPSLLARPYDLNWFAGVRYVPQFYPGAVTLFEAQDTARGPKSMLNRWLSVAGGGVEAHEIQGRHDNLFEPPQIARLAAEITDCLARRHTGPVSLLRGMPR